LALTLGRLVAPFPPPVTTNFSYWLVTLPETADTPRIAAFRAWLLDDAGTTGAP
jgi:LysR family transcriptional regulator, glycine cleavage system transcriptional activator